MRSILAPHANTFLAEARDAAEGKRFWADRKKLGAIARRTNAFKMNEDVVLPLEALAGFARFIDGLNKAVAELKTRGELPAGAETMKRIGRSGKAPWAWAGRGSVAADGRLL